MPTTPTQEFSYDRDVGAYASRFFDTIGNDSRLSPERKAQLQGTLLGGVEDIEAQRLKLQEERDNGQMRSLKMQGYQSDLEDARAKRIQMQKDSEAINGAKSRVSGILADEKLTAEQKRQMLAIEELEHPMAGDTKLGRLFNLGREALPKEEGASFTPGQTVNYLSKLAGKVSPEELSLAMRDPVAMSAMIAEADAAEKEAAEAEKLRSKNDAESNEIKKGMMLKDLKFAKDENTGMQSSWLEEESTRDAEMIVRALGSAEEQKTFEDLRDSDSDEARADLVRSIQRRELESRLNGKKAPDEDRKSKIRSLIFGK